MKVFIDTNIYLDFFREKDSDSLKYIQSILNLISEGKFELVLPVQTKNEFLINKIKVIETEIAELKSNNLVKTTKLVDFMNTESKNLDEIAVKFNKMKDKVISEYKKKALDSKSDVNKGINKLFQKAKIFEDNDEIIQRAYFRTLRGYPPRKGNASFGDTIIWESLLQYCKNDDLIIIARDSDWKSEGEETKIHDFLQEEWQEKTKGKTLRLYRNLGKFINDNSPKSKKPISKELIKKEEQNLGVYRYLDQSLIEYKKIHNIASTALGYGEANCECCNKVFSSNKYSRALNGNKCDNCSGIYLGPGKTCSKCNKHFHENSPVHRSIIESNLCSECSTNYC